MAAMRFLSQCKSAFRRVRLAPPSSTSLLNLRCMRYATQSSTQKDEAKGRSKSRRGEGKPLYDTEKNESRGLFHPMNSMERERQQFEWGRYMVKVITNRKMDISLEKARKERDSDIPKLRGIQRRMLHNTYIKVCTLAGDLQAAEKGFRDMVNDKLCPPPNSSTFGKLIKGCFVSYKVFYPSRALYWYKIYKSMNLPLDTVLENATIYILLKSDDKSHAKIAEKIFQKLKDSGHADGYAYEMFMRYHGRNSDLKQCMDLFQELKKSKKKVGALNYHAMLEAYLIAQKYKEAEEFYNTVKSTISNYQIFHSTMIRAYGDMNDIKKAEKCMHNYINSDSFRRLLRTGREEVNERNIFQHIILACIQTENVDKARRWYDKAAKLFSNPAFCPKNMMKGYVDSGDLKKAVELYEKFLTKSKSHLNTEKMLQHLIVGLVNAGEANKAIKIEQEYSKMVKIPPQRTCILLSLIAREVEKTNMELFSEILDISMAREGTDHGRIFARISPEKVLKWAESRTSSQLKTATNGFVFDGLVNRIVINLRYDNCMDAEIFSKVAGMINKPKWMDSIVTVTNDLAVLTRIIMTNPEAPTKSSLIRFLNHADRILSEFVENPRNFRKMKEDISSMEGLINALCHSPERFTGMEDKVREVVDMVKHKLRLARKAAGVHEAAVDFEVLLSWNRAAKRNQKMRLLESQGKRDTSVNDRSKRIKAKLPGNQDSEEAREESTVDATET
ncbi:hypothetical protein AAMO2058_001271700 [Amorphochlora amoebiformis]